jgi:hypothetical protein
MENMTSQLSLCVSNLYNHVFPTYAIAWTKPMHMVMVQIDCF